MKRKAASRQLCNGHCRSLTLPVHNHRTGCKDRLKHNRLQYPQIGISRLRMVIRRGKFPFAARHWLYKTARQGCCNDRVWESRCDVCVLSAFPGRFSKGFPWGGKYVRHILKYIGHIFSCLRRGVNALKISFHFSRPKMPYFADKFRTFREQTRLVPGRPLNLPVPAAGVPAFEAIACAVVIFGLIL